jgi:SAM-dependent methyltransferase
MSQSVRQLVRAGYDRVAPEYLAARPTDGADAQLLDELAVYLSPGDLVLDAGCGAGVPVEPRLRAAGYSVVGLDLSAAQLDLAVGGGFTDVVQGDLVSLPFRTGAFRAAVSFYAIIHVPRDDHLEVFRELRRVVEPDGHVLVCLGARDVPADHDPYSWLGAPMYWSHFDAETNVELLQEAGLTVLWHRLVDDPMGHADHLFALARP